MDVAERSLPDGAGAPALDPWGFAQPHGSIRGLQRIVGHAWRLGFRARFLLFQRHRHNRVVLETVAGKPVVVLPTVLNPALFFTGQWLATLIADPSGWSRTEMIPVGASVLDLGCGSGVVSVFAAQRAGRVVATDINPAAVRCTRINALLNGVDGKVEVREGDLFAPLAGERFDVIVFNPPYLPGAPRSDFERALRSEGLAERFAAGLGEHLAPGGVAWLLLSSIGDAAGWLDALRRQGYAIQTAATRNIVSETLALFRVSRDGRL